MDALISASRGGDYAQNEALIEALATQALARAAYKGERFHDLPGISRAVAEIAPTAGTFLLSGSAARPRTSLATEAAHRIASLIGLATE